MASIDDFDSSEQVFAREKCDFYDESNRKSKGELVVMQRRIVFLEKRQQHHAIGLEAIRGLYVETTGMIGAYLRVDFDSPYGISIARYKGSLAQVEHLMGHIKESMSSIGVIQGFGESDVAGGIGGSIEVLQYSRPEIIPMKGRYDDICACGLYCMWWEVAVLAATVIWGGGTLSRGFELPVIVLFTVTSALTSWWVTKKRQRTTEQF